MTETEELFLPEPLPREVKYTVISVDDHVVEPPHTFEGRLPKHLQDRAPRVADRDGLQIWEFEDQKFTQVGMNAIAGRKPTQKKEPFRFDQMRKSCYDVDARVRDMDVNGVWAAVNFPSMVTGFCGRVFFNAEDRELGQACIRAWNDWLYEEWYVAHPTRIIPLGIAMLSDPEAAVAEIHRNADRGFTGISMPERPHMIGLPDLWQREHWDPIIQACVETETVISLHVGSSGSVMGPPDAPGLQIGATLFGQLSLTSAAEWLWSEYAVKHPDIKIAMSEGGIGWVAMLIDRLDNLVDRSGYGRNFAPGLRPADVLHRNFWFCTIDDPSTLSTLPTVGVDHVMFETDYPHGDGTWPDSQAVFADVFGDLPADWVAKISHENAARLFRHPLPPPGSPHAAGLR